MFHFEKLYGQTHNAGKIVNIGNDVYSIAHNRVIVYDVQQLQQHSLDYQGFNNLVQIEVSQCGNYLLTVDTQQYMQLVSLQTEQLIKHNLFFQRCQLFALSNKTSDFVAVYNLDTVRLHKVNLSTLRNDQQLQFTEVLKIQTSQQIQQIKFSPDDSLLSLTQQTGSVIIYVIGQYTSQKITKFKQLQSFNETFNQKFFELSVNDQIIDCSFYEDKQLQQNDFINIFDDQILLDLTTQKLTELQQHQINEQYVLGTISKYTLIITTQSGVLHKFNPGGAKAEPFSWFSSDEFQLKLGEEQSDQLIALSANFSQSQNQLIVTTQQGYFVLFSFIDSQQLFSVSATSYPLTSALIINEQQIACASFYQKQFFLFNHQIEAFQIQEESVSIMSFAKSPDDLYIALGSVNGIIYIYNTITGLLINQYQAHQSAVKSIQFFSSSKATISGGADCVCCYDLNKQIIFRKLETASNLFELVAVEAQGEVAVASDGQFRINVFDLQTGKLMSQMQQHEGPITMLQFRVAVSGELVSSSWDRTVRVNNLFTGQNQLVIDESCEVLGFSVNEVLNKMLVYLNDGSINSYSLDEEKRDLQVNYQNVSKQLQHQRYFKNADGQKFTAMVSYADLIVGGGKSKYLLIYKNNTVQSRIQLSVNYDFSNVDVDVIDNKNRKTHNQVKFSKQLEEQTKKQDMKTRKVFDPIIALENKKPEMRVMQLEMSQSGDRVYVLTPVGLFVYTNQQTSRIGANYVVQQFNNNINYDQLKQEVENKQSSTAKSLLTLIQCCQINQLELYDKLLYKLDCQFVDEVNISQLTLNDHLVLLKINNFATSNKLQCQEVAVIFQIKLIKYHFVQLRNTRKYSHIQTLIISEIKKFKMQYKNDVQIIQVLNDSIVQYLKGLELDQGREFDVEQQKNWQDEILEYKLNNKNNVLFKQEVEKVKQNKVKK